MNTWKLITIFILATLITLTSTISHAINRNGWVYQDPYPTSNTLHAAKFVSQKKGWIAGVVGTILFTQDGGETWEVQESGTKQALTSIEFVNDKTGWAVGDRGVIIHTDDGGKNWALQSETKQYLVKIVFVDEHEGWIACQNGLLHTTDGGKNWIPNDSGIKGSISCIFFINTNIGWVLAEGAVYKTEDNGGTWIKTMLPQDEYPPFRVPDEIVLKMLGSEGDLFFSNPKNGWAVMGFGLIFETKDGGETWTNRLHSSSSSYGFNRISFFDDMRGCATGSSIVCTEDGGITWSERSLTTSRKSKWLEGFWLSVELYDLSFLRDSSLGWAVGKDGQIMKTADGGKTWKMIARKDECGRYVFFVNHKIGWFYDLGQDTFICRTNDAGQSRQKQEVGMNVRGVYFIDGKTGWAVGARKKPEGKQLPGRQPGKVWAVIKYTADGGKTWKTEFEKLVNNDLYFDAFIDVYFVDKNHGWAVGEKGLIVHTSDGGNHWENQQSSISDADLWCLQFVDSNNGWITGMRVANGWTGIILHTEDGGKHWQTQYSLRDVGLASLYFVNEKRGFVTGESESGNAGWLIQTDDSGKSWRKSDFGDIGQSDITICNNAHVVLSTYKGWLIISSDGGKTWSKRRKSLHSLPWSYSDEAKNCD